MGGVFDFLCFKVKKQVSRKGAKGAKKRLHLSKAGITGKKRKEI